MKSLRILIATVMLICPADTSQKQSGNVLKTPHVPCSTENAKTKLKSRGQTSSFDVIILVMIGGLRGIGHILQTAVRFCIEEVYIKFVLTPTFSQLQKIPKLILPFFL